MVKLHSGIFVFALAIVGYKYGYMFLFHFTVRKWDMTAFSIAPMTSKDVTDPFVDQPAVTPALGVCT